MKLDRLNKEEEEPEMNLDSDNNSNGLFISPSKLSFSPITNRLPLFDLTKPSSRSELLISRNSNNDKALFILA